MILSQCETMQVDLSTTDRLTEDLLIFYSSKAGKLLPRRSFWLKDQRVIVLCGYDWYWRYQDLVEDYIADHIVTTHPGFWYEDDRFATADSREVIRVAYDRGDITRRDIALLTRERMTQEVWIEWELPLRDIILLADEAEPGDEIEPIDMGER